MYPFGSMTCQSDQHANSRMTLVIDTLIDQVLFEHAWQVSTPLL
jgi:hypothetical protein